MIFSDKRNYFSALFHQLKRQKKLINLLERLDLKRIKIRLEYANKD